MTQDVRQQALAALSEAAALAPDVRLGQMMAFLGFLGEDQVEHSLWDIEDHELLAVLQRHRADLMARLQDATGIAASVSETAPASLAPSRIQR